MEHTNKEKEEISVDSNTENKSSASMQYNIGSSSENIQCVKSCTLSDGIAPNSKQNSLSPNVDDIELCKESEDIVHDLKRNSVGKLDSVAEVQETSNAKPIIPNIPVAGTTVNRRMPHLHKLEKKHSSGDLHSRLKTRKLLGVGETDDGDVHRSKLSQILGHSDQLYIRLPSGLRLWQIILAVVLSVLSLWAFIFPSHYFHAMYDMDGSNISFPIRLYASALICISLMYWSTLQASDRDVIRMILLSSIVFFTLQSIVVVFAMITLTLSTTRWSVTLLGLQCMCVLISYFFLCGLVAARPVGCMKKTTSSKDLSEKDQ